MSHTAPVIERCFERLPRRGGQACLVAIYGIELGKKFDLDRPRIVIGRSSKADIQIDQEAISRKHCTFVSANQAVLVRDARSTNGTYVNNKLVEEQELADGDLVKVGRCIFKFLSSDDLEAAYQEELRRLTTVDGLTQVFTRRYLVEALEREVGRASQGRSDLSLVMIDFDRFKDVNDSFGYLAGDHVLMHLAAAFKSQLRPEDVLGRYGGQEFAIVLPGVDHSGARQLSEEIRKLVELTEVKVESVPISITVSIGVASLRGQADDARGLLRRAEASLVAAKESGRNRVA